MFRIDVGNNRNIGWQFQEGAIAFIGFNNHPVTIAHTSIGAISIDNAAVDDGGIEMTCIKQSCNHRCGRGFAMCAADSNRTTEAHQLGQHFSAANNRQKLFAGGSQFRISFLDGSRNDDDFRVAKILGLMTDKDLNALLA